MSTSPRLMVVLMTLLVLLSTVGIPGEAVRAESNSCSLTADEEAAAMEVVGQFRLLGIVQWGRGGGSTAERLAYEVTRAGFAVLLTRALGWEEHAQEDRPATFSDTQGHWAAGYIALLAGEGIVRGQPGGTFEPDALITPPQMHVMLARTLHAHPHVTLENAGELLKALGVSTEVPCSSPGSVRMSQALLMLDRTMHAPIYARFQVGE